jgi:hypothetical protein
MLSRSRARAESQVDVEAFALRACRTIVDGNRDAYRDLLVRPADTSVDRRYGWLPFSGAKVEDFPAWTQRAQANLEAFDRRGTTADGCGRVIAVAQDSTSADPGQRRIASISIEVARSPSGPVRVLEIGPSVLTTTTRGRVLQGAQDGTFARWRD